MRKLRFRKVILVSAAILMNLGMLLLFTASDNGCTCACLNPENCPDLVNFVCDSPSSVEIGETVTVVVHAELDKGIVDEYHSDCYERYKWSYVSIENGKIILSSSPVFWKRVPEENTELTTTVNVKGTQKGQVDIYIIDEWETDRSPSSLCTITIVGPLEEPSTSHTVPVQPPTVTTLNAVPGTDSAVLNGRLEKGTAEEVFVSFEWGETEAYGNETEADSVTSDNYFFHTELSSLEEDTTYYFRAKAIVDDTPPYYGDGNSFRTGGSASIVTEEPPYDLTVSSTIGGKVTSPSEGPHTYDRDEVVNLVAVPDIGYRFTGWQGDVAETSSATTTITMDADKSVTARFLRLPPFVLTSSAFDDGAPIPSEYSRDGGNRSPPLEWTGVPPGTQSFVLIMKDPVGWGEPCVHWIVFNIPSHITSLEEGAASNLPEGAVQGRGSDRFGYYGCEPPPERTRSYYFTLYALDTMLDLAQGATEQDVMDAMEGHVRHQAELVGTYKGEDEGYTPPN